jgi:hypothetical protein
VLGDLSTAWNWLASDDGAAVEYLRGYGSPTWEGLSNWSHFRDVRRWRYSGLTPDRHITPISIDFWGVLGDYARDAVRNTERMKRFMPSFTNPGLDWRDPRLGVLLLDEVSVEPVVSAGQWTFATLFAFGMRLGRVGAITAQFADADEDTEVLFVDNETSMELIWSSLGKICELERGEDFIAYRIERRMGPHKGFW